MPNSALALDFPALTGRVVDQAGVMTAAGKSDVAAKSKALEEKSGIQLAVAVVSSLQGSDVETYANQLFRFWKLGDATNNNGVLLVVAPAEHKVRIEVGYGLEGTLTDALSSVIIASTIIPRFKVNDYSGGIERGVDATISVLSGDTVGWQPKVLQPPRANDELGLALVITWCVFVVAAIFIIGYISPRRKRSITRDGRPVVVASDSSSSSWSWSSGSSSGSSYSSSSGSSGGGFSGGGGSSGGGGASGSW